MGQKTNPIGNRLGIIRGWESNWYGGKNFGDMIAEDETIRRTLISDIQCPYSCSIKKATTFPPLPLLKSFHICLAGETIKLGVFSSVNGLKPLKFDPDFFN